MLTESLAALADKLYDIGAIKFGGFRLKLHETQPDAPLSPIYLNLRVPENKDGPLDEAALRMIGPELSLLHFLAAENRSRYVCGLPKAGEPLADAMTWRSPTVELIHMQKEEHADGTRKITAVIDELEPGTVDLVDDLVTQADTKFEAIAAAEAAGLKVGRIILLVDRMQGGSNQLRLAGYNVDCVFTLWDLLAHYLETGRINSDMMAKVIDYITSNRVA